MERGGAHPPEGLVTSWILGRPPIIMKNELVAIWVATVGGSDGTQILGFEPRLTFIIDRGDEQTLSRPRMETNDLISVPFPAILYTPRGASTPKGGGPLVHLDSFSLEFFGFRLVQLTLYAENRVRTTLLNGLSHVVNRAVNLLPG